MRPVSFGGRAAAWAGSGHTGFGTTDVRRALVTGQSTFAAGVTATDRLLLR
jgi:hypothetical protein